MASSQVVFSPRATAVSNHQAAAVKTARTEPLLENGLALYSKSANFGRQIFNERLANRYAALALVIGQFGGKL